MNINAPSDTRDEALPLSRFLTFRLARIQSQLNVQASRLLRERAGLSLTQWRILALLGQAGGVARSNELTREPSFDKGMFSRKLKTLIEAGLVDAQPADDDSRVHILKFTETGLSLYERTLPIMQSRQRLLNAAMPPEDLEVFHRCLDRLDAASKISEFE